MYLGCSYPCDSDRSKKNFYHPLLNDSKQLTHEERDLLRPIIEKESICWAVASVSNDEIDQINILQASYKAMHLALNKLKAQPGILLIDGNRFKPYKKMPHHCMVKGDENYASIAAASILAKTYRDEYMITLHEEFNMYAWHSNKGYGTKAHREAIDHYGVSRYHRLSWRFFSETIPDKEEHIINSGIEN